MGNNANLALKPSTRNRREHHRLVMEALVGLAELRTPFHFLVRRPRFEGRIANASAAGLELVLDRELATGLELLVWVQVEHGGGIETLRLRGVVRLSRPSLNPGTLLAGVQLHPRPREAMRTWAVVMREELTMLDTARFDIAGPLSAPRPRGGRRRDGRRRRR